MGRMKQMLKQYQALEKVSMPSSALEILEMLLSKNEEVHGIAATFMNSMNQKSQASALRLLGVHLERHLGQNSIDMSLPGLITRFLLLVLLESPDAPYSVRAAALRSAVEGLKRNLGEDVLSSFWCRMEAFSRLQIADEKFRGLPQAANVAYSDAVVRNLLFTHPERHLFAAKLADEICADYVHLQDSEESGLAKLPASETEVIVLAAVKMLQELFQNVASGSLALNDSSLEDTVKRTNAILKSLVMADQLPRGCAMAAAMCVVTGTCLSFDEDNRDLETRLMSLIESSAEFEASQIKEAFSRVVLCRALIEVPLARTTAQNVLYIENGIFDQLCDLSRHSDPHLCTVAFESVLSVLHRSKGHEFRGRLRDKTLSLIIDRWHERLACEALEALISMSSEDRPYWEKFCEDLLDLDWRRSGKYSLMTSMLPYVGAKRFLQIEGDAQNKTFQAIHENQTVAKTGCDFLKCIWKQLKSDVSEDEFYELTISDLVKALAHKDHGTRERITEIALPMYIKICKAEGIKRLKESAEKLSAESLPDKNFDSGPTEPLSAAKSSSELYDEEGLLHAVVSAVSFGKKVLGFRSSLSGSSFEIINDALSCRDILVRICALEYLVVGKAETEPYEKEEMHLLRFAVPIAFMPDGSPAQNSRIRHLFRDLWERLRCSRGCARATTGWWDRMRKEADKEARRAEFEAKRAAYVADSAELLRWLCLFMAKNSFPGSSHKRRLLSILTLQEASQVVMTDEAVQDVAVQISHAMIISLVDGWDRIRTQAYESLKVFESPTLGIEEEEIPRLLSFSSHSIRSPRLREADAGALQWKAIFTRAPKSNRNRELRIAPTKQNVEVEALQETSSEQAQLSLLKGVLKCIQFMTEQGESNLAGACEEGLVHGFALTLRYMLEETSYAGIELNFEAFESFADECINVCRRAIGVSMQGVAFHEPNVNAHELEPNQVIKAIGKMDKPKRNGEEHTITLTNDLTIVLIFQGTDEKQKFVTSSFLSVAELCGALATLVHRAPFKEETNGSGRGLLSTGNILSVLELFDHVLRNTRHTGVIEKSSDDLRELPLKVLNETLSSAESGSLYVLRRSAGLPFYVLAILGSERIKSRRQYLDIAVRRLIDITKSGAMSKASDGEQAQVAVSHAMNILRVLFTDGTLADAMMPFVGETFLYTVPRFSDASWMIRNSAMMLFGALLRRGVGLGITQPGGKVPGIGVTGREFFSRYPQIHPLLLSTLEEVASRIDKGEGGAASSHDVFSLFPILVLLSSLQSSVGSDPSKSLSMTAFLPHVLKCARSKDDAIRRVAAKAASSVLNSEQAHEITSAALKISRTNNYSAKWKTHRRDLELFQFLWHGEQGKEYDSVDVQGSFNDFKQAIPLTRQTKEGPFQAEYPLPPGKYLYYFQVDNEICLRQDLPVVKFDEQEEYNVAEVAQRKPGAVPESFREYVGPRRTANAIHGVLLAGARVMEAQLNSSEHSIEAVEAVCETIIRKGDILECLGNPTSCDFITTAQMEILLIGLEAVNILSARSKLPEDLTNFYNQCADVLFNTYLFENPTVKDVWSLSVISKAVEILLQLPGLAIVRHVKDIILHIGWEGHDNTKTMSYTKLLTKALRETGEEFARRIGSTFSADAGVASRLNELEVVNRQFLAEILNSQLYPDFVAEVIQSKQQWTMVTLGAFGVSTGPSVSETTLALFGIMIREMLKATYLGEAELQSHMKEWTEALSVRCGSENSMAARLAVCSSLTHSRVLSESVPPERKSEGNGDWFVAAWTRAHLIVLELLQDDDEEVRSAALQAVGSKKHVLVTQENIYRRLCVYQDPMCLEQLDSVLDLHVEFKSGKEIGLLSWLANHDMVESNPEMVFSQQNTILDALQGGDEDGRIFDTEADNLYTEVVLSVQLALVSISHIRFHRRCPKWIIERYVEALSRTLRVIYDTDTVEKYLLGCCRNLDVYRVLFLDIAKLVASIVLSQGPLEPNLKQKIAEVATLARRCKLHISLTETVHSLERLTLETENEARFRLLREVCFLLPGKSNQ